MQLVRISVPEAVNVSEGIQAVVCFRADFFFDMETYQVILSIEVEDISTCKYI